jgi:hypothetical protein
MTEREHRWAAPGQDPPGARMNDRVTYAVHRPTITPSSLPG